LSITEHIKQITLFANRAHPSFNPSATASINAHQVTDCHAKANNPTHASYATLLKKMKAMRLTLLGCFTESE
jgi:hypothetical protein